MTTYLSQLLKEKIISNGDMPFEQFMHEALYTSDLGYYMSRTPLFGKKGDFITAPEISDHFAKTLGNFCIPLIKTFPNSTIVEFGAGTGKLACDLLSHLKKFQNLPNAYWIVDVSPELRKLQKANLTKVIPEWVEKIEWFDSIEALPAFTGIVLGNEVVDAFPAARFVTNEEGAFDVHVTIKNDEFTEVLYPTKHEYVKTLAQNIQDTHEFSKNKTYCSEWLPGLPEFFKKLYQRLEQGVALFIDYGFPRHEFYHIDRYMGTLMCHYQHKANTNPYEYVGLQDITTHIDFTDVAEKAYDAGFHIAGYTQQAPFLTNCGLLTIQDTHQFTHNPTQALYNLTSPSEMGELFKVIGLTKKYDNPPLLGFQHWDKRHTL